MRTFYCYKYIRGLSCCCCCCLPFFNLYCHHALLSSVRFNQIKLFGISYMCGTLICVSLNALKPEPILLLLAHEVLVQDKSK